MLIGILLSCQLIFEELENKQKTISYITCFVAVLTMLYHEDVRRAEWAIDILSVKEACVKRFQDDANNHNSTLQKYQSIQPIDYRCGNRKKRFAS